MTDALSSSDTYDILAGLRADRVELARECRMYGRMEMGDVLQMPHWWSKVSRLLTEAAYEMEKRA